MRAVFFAVLMLLSGTMMGAETTWKNGPPADPGFFPITVWLQSPANAAKYKAAGINTYVGLWKGPTEEQLKALKDAGLYVICGQNEVGLKHKDDMTIIGWMHGDEPDNAQSLGKGKGYGPPIPPQKIVEDYERMKEKDPTRPVILNLGQGVAWDGWVGRGTRTNHPEDYPEYARGGDIVSFDIYPVAHKHKDVQGKLWMVPQGVERLAKAAGSEKTIWTCIECTHISEPKKKATPHQIKAEVWMALIAGARGLIYFCHEFKPKFIEAGLLHDPVTLKAVTEINAQIKALAPVLNSPSLKDAATVASSSAGVPVSLLVKEHDGAKYLFSACMRESATTATFKLAHAGAGTDAGEVEVIGENRKLSLKQGEFKDEFKPYDVHLYKVALKR